jgi:excinuclease ABC subunit B
LDVLNLIRELEGEMRDAAVALEYERAALLRDQIRELKASAGLPATEVAGAEKFGKSRPVNYRGVKKRGVAKA